MSCDVIANHNNITVSKLPKEADVIKTVPQFQNAHPPKKPLHFIVSTRHLRRFSQFKGLQTFILFRIAAIFTHVDDGLMGQNQYHMVFVWAQTDKFAVEFVSSP